MSHLTDEQLAAQLDAPASGAPDASAAAHMATCESCRARMAELASLDDSLARALTHDPGEAYFATFADRVAGRMAAEAAPVAAAAPRASGLFAWWNSGRGLAWAGGTVALLAVAALAVVVARDRGTRPTAERAPASEVGSAAPQQAENAPPPSASEPLAGREAGRDHASAPPPHPRDALSPPTPQQFRAQVQGQPSPVQPLVPMSRGSVAPQHVVELKTLANGEQIAVSRNDMPVRERSVNSVRTPSGFIKPGAQSMAPRQEARDDRAAAGGAPSPAAERSFALAPGPPASSAAKSLASAQAPSPEPAPNRQLTETSADEVAPLVHVCGTVRDVRGHALGGVVLSVAETGMSTTTAGDGTFCLDAAGPHPTVEAFTVGYHAYRGDLSISTPAQPVAVVLLPVETLARTPDWGRISASYRANALATPGGEMQSPIPGSSTLTARTASADANRLRSVVAWQHAAEEWLQALGRATGSPSLLDDARFHVAEARVNAWRIGHTRAERVAADAAVHDYLASAASGPLRDLGEGWRKEVAE